MTFGGEYQVSSWGVKKRLKQKAIPGGVFSKNKTTRSERETQNNEWVWFLFECDECSVDDKARDGGRQRKEALIASVKCVYYTSYPNLFRLLEDSFLKGIDLRHWIRIF